MRISRIEKTTKLPEMISGCKGTVSLVLNEDQAFPINENEKTLQFFRQLWLCRDDSSIELKCSCPEDAVLLTRAIQ